MHIKMHLRMLLESVKREELIDQTNGILLDKLVRKKGKEEKEVAGKFGLAIGFP